MDERPIFADRQNGCPLDIQGSEPAGTGGKSIQNQCPFLLSPFYHWQKHSQIQGSESASSGSCGN